MNPGASSFKVRSAITGHGQEGEFIPQNHYIDVNGGANEYTWQVWKECAENPIYPQGGTWIYDRAGWCPGRPTDLQEFDITPFVTPGQAHSLDYGVNGGSGTSNYIVNNQLVEYGAPNFTLDAAIVDIMNPSDYVEYDRVNAICSTPKVVLQNTGSTTLTEVVIEYWINDDANHQTYTWTGSLDFLGKEEVELPTPAAMWNALSTTNVFHATVKNPNNGTDEYDLNDHYETGFTIPDVVPTHFFIEFKTNNAASESSYQLLDDNGNVLFERFGMSNNTLYRDTLNFGLGCYQFRVQDTDDDGISFWANNDGNGYVRIREVGGGVVKGFDPDFGQSIIYNFTIDFPLSYEELNDVHAIDVYPNPTQGKFYVEAGSISEAIIDIYNAQGQLLSLIHISEPTRL